MTIPRMVPADDAHALARLSDAERDVLVAIAQGSTTKEIAAARGRSPKTVAAQRDSLRQKLRARTAADLTRFAVRVGLVAA